MNFAVSNDTMRLSDKLTIEGGVASIELMRRAGEEIYNSAKNEWGKKCAIVCGGGNNAGDGFVLALCMKKNGLFPHIVLIEEKFSKDGEFYFKKCREQGIEYSVFTQDFDFSPFDSIADCIFGTGFRGKVDGVAKACIEKINDSGKFVVSADINSGICGDGGFSDDCVISNLTVAVQFYKSGHFLGVAKDKIGKLCVVNIGIDLYGEKIFVPKETDLADIVKKRDFNSHKGSYGYVAIIGGCLEYSGAAKLANIAACAMRSGCGVIKLGVARSVASSVAPYLLESTLFPIPDVDGHMIFDKASFEALMKGTTAISCGMGWGTSEENPKILKFLLENYEGTLIIDADGLNTLSRMDESIIIDRKCRKIVLTPHPLEFSRISGYSMDKIFEDPIGCAKEYVERLGEGAVLLLKGTASIVCDQSEIYIVNRGCAGMATAGSGDVLSGVLTGLFGYINPCAKSVACGGMIAGIAGEMAQEEYGDICMVASDTVKYIPTAVKKVRGEG